MGKKLVIVESPAKAKTIKKYLGRGYDVVASMGHVRDLPKSKLGVDIENRFSPQYINVRSQSEVIKKLKAAAKDKSKIYLATDPDREGEAISWHLATLLSVDLNEENRVTFNEITPNGVVSGMKSPRKVDIDLVNSQQARRILDRIVGYKLSPFLWKKVKSGLSAGRVQSVTVKLIVDREEEIKAFVSEEYWSIEANLNKINDKENFAVKFYGIGDKKQDINSKEEADIIIKGVEKSDFIVKDIKKSVRKKHPSPPFITSTLQQEASNKLGFQSKRTMRAAQELYEGIDVDEMGAVGLITYMRTDSLRISDDARQSAYKYIKETYGQNYIPESDNIYKSKKSAQDAHEAIRPSIPELTPTQLKSSLSSDQYKLYDLIWKRFIASQMADSLLDTVSVKISASKYMFTTSGSTVKFDGFTVVYDNNKQGETILPLLDSNEKLNLNEIKGNQHFTQPPPRYTEATLIKVLEENGIGRPSTYAPTITTILSRNYVERDAKQLKPTLLGEITTNLMREYFVNIVDAEFTANMEEKLDMIQEGKIEWTEILEGFYGDFATSLESAEIKTEGQSFKIPDEESDIDCDICGEKMVIKVGRFGKFLACKGYPDCKNTKRIVQETKGICPKCGGKIVENKSKKGKKFFGCSKYPDCDFVSWDAPIDESCPLCEQSLLKKMGKLGKIYCSNQSCEYERGLKD